ncbi:hypothetical protein LCGC14_1584330 [marine sediment metagenome]|uniref:Uncharacterized protein n=1 Tax=marine sediment metagenome TaxID=412755 RepID=A0A0F9LG83_9ZZZZ
MTISCRHLINSYSNQNPTDREINLYRLWKCSRCEKWYSFARYCVCKNWHGCMPQIVNAQVFCNNQSAGPKYKGAKFKFCPWCGRKLSTLKGGLNNGRPEI